MKNSRHTTYILANDFFLHFNLSEKDCVFFTNNIVPTIVLQFGKTQVLDLDAYY